MKYSKLTNFLLFFLISRKYFSPENYKTRPMNIKIQLKINHLFYMDDLSSCVKKLMTILKVN